jgi:hydroxyacylglutathione hydrolase
LLFEEEEDKMHLEIQTINLAGVNCYLVKTGADYMLIDTGFKNKRADLDKELERAGCQPGNLKLIVITHGDFDHTGNGAYLREKYSTKIAMHQDDAGMVEHGDMLWNRKSNLLTKILFSLPFFKLSVSDRFTPDILVEDGDDLSGYGYDAQVLHIPGHSKGSIGILSADGDLFCGDLFMNSDKPGFSNIYIESPVANASLEKLKSFAIKTVYPGHGKPFSLDSLTNNPA